MKFIKNLLIVYTTVCIIAYIIIMCANLNWLSPEILAKYYANQNMIIDVLTINIMIAFAITCVLCYWDGYNDGKKKISENNENNLNI